MAENVEVAIIGSGSAGLCAAMWLARYGIKCKILEKRNGPLELGQADGVQCRTVEIFESFNLEHILLRDSYHVLEITFWAAGDGEPQPGEKRKISRTGRTADTRPGLSHQPHVIMNQAQINQLMLDEMKRENGQTVDYGHQVTSIKLNKDNLKDPKSYPVEITTEKDGKQERFNARYAFGSDGAHSAVRHSLGIKMEGDSSDSVWGVMDTYVRTDFPDIRKKVTIRSDSGTLMIIPREGGSLVRFYVELPHGVNAKKVTLAELQEKAKAVFYPYEMEFVDHIWWSAYGIGQRLASALSEGGRIFLGGDACHTHSPKAGQGMNTSLQDGYNFGWKLGSVLTGQAQSKLLDTYVSERHQTAAALIDFDRQWSKMFSSNPSGGKKTTPDEIRKGFIKAGEFTAGMAAHYKDSMIVSNKNSSQDLAKNVTVGMRFPSAQVVRLCDSKVMQLLKLCQSDRRWRVFVFGGKVDEASKLHVMPSINQIGTYLSSPASPVNRFTPAKASTDSVIETIVVLNGDRNLVEFSSFHPFFTPVSGKYQIRDLDKIFFDDESFNQGHGHAYENYGIDMEVGCIVIVRPDQYVSAVFGLEEYEKSGAFFEGIFNPQ